MFAVSRLYFNNKLSVYQHRVGVHCHLVGLIYFSHCRCYQLFQSSYWTGIFDLSSVSKYGCRRAIFADILLLGSRAVMPFSRSTSSSFRVGVWSCIGIPLNRGNEVLKSGNFRASGQLFSCGDPNILNILKIWSISLSPVKSGLFWAISANMQPVDHRSTPRE